LFGVLLDFGFHLPTTKPLKSMTNHKIIETPDRRKRRRVSITHSNYMDPMVVLYHVVPFLQTEEKFKFSITSKTYRDMLCDQIIPEWRHMAWMLLDIDTLPTLNKWMEKIEDSVYENNFIDDCDMKHRIFLNLYYCWQRMKNGEHINFEPWIPLLKKYQWIRAPIICLITLYFYDPKIEHRGFRPLIDIIRREEWLDGSTRHWLESEPRYEPDGRIGICWNNQCECTYYCPVFEKMNPQNQQILKSVCKNRLCYFSYDMRYPSHESLVRLLFENYGLFLYVTSMGICEYLEYNVEDIILRKDVPMEFIDDHFLRNYPSCSPCHPYETIEMEEFGSQEYMYDHFLENKREDVFMRCFDYQQNLFFTEPGLQRLKNVVMWCNNHKSKQCFDFVYDMALKYTHCCNDEQLLLWIKQAKYSQ
jgi:hypothetical protein